MAQKQTIDAMWDDSPIDVSTEVNFIWYATITISFRQRCFNAVCLDLEMAFLLKNLEMEN